MCNREKFYDTNISPIIEDINKLFTSKGYKTSYCLIALATLLYTAIKGIDKNDITLMFLHIFIFSLSKLKMDQETRESN